MSDSDEQISLDDITFEGKSLTDWLDELTIQMPPLPMNHQDATMVARNTHNKYQIAYNCYISLTVYYNDANRRLQAMKNSIIAKAVEDFKEKGVGRMPSKEALEALALAAEEIKSLNEEVCMYEAIKDFFESNKNKLEKSIQLVLNVSYQVGQNDKVWNKQGSPHA